MAEDRQPLRTGARKALFDEAMTSPEHDCPQIHVQHYMIDPPTFAKGKRYDYKTAAQMKIDVERSGRVRAILSGHHHPGSLVESGGVIHSLPPAFCEAPHAFRIYDIDIDGDTKVTDFNLDG